VEEFNWKAPNKVSRVLAQNRLAECDSVKDRAGGIEL
jgi:hypothetical protein